ncbi:STAS domain-containing protein [Pontibacillus salipaludis]|uniref:STAS domain-containing protein n=1 Tax=Pontibacillus salipaludis TaxID=1697394 RepID=UPI0031E9E532
MKQELEYIGNKIINHKRDLAHAVEALEAEEFISTLKTVEIPYDQIITWRTELIEIIGDSLIENHDDVMNRTREWAHRVGQKCLDIGVPLNESLRSLAFFRTVIWDVFEEDLEQQNFSAVTMLDVSKLINPLLDEVSYIFSNLIVRDHQKTMNIAQLAMEELSVPVVPITKGVAILPLIGEIDTHRAKLIMESTLKHSTDDQLDYLIIDVSGVPMIDTMVANNIFSIIQALTIMGVEASITGMRPEIAQTVISLGINFKDINSYANMQQALEKIGFTHESQLKT